MLSSYTSDKFMLGGGMCNHPNPDDKVFLCIVGIVIVIFAIVLLIK